jgi:hypothetical protein
MENGSLREKPRCKETDQAVILVTQTTDGHGFAQGGGHCGSEMMLKGPGQIIL